MKHHICTQSPCPAQDLEAVRMLSAGFRTSYVDLKGDGIALFSGKHEGPMGELMREERTIGELLVAKEKPSILFKLLNLFK